ncbi:MAG: hypothetical protein IJW73_04450 [Candidatus Gastranaerophilales bacterium]|nr:hypothetical protein [Candidatus Gastranaerophilales bacterium]
MKKNHKFGIRKAFTLFEALVCFAIMGAVFASTLTQIKINDKYQKLYWVAFDTLLQASKNASSAFTGNIGCRCSQYTGLVDGCDENNACVCWHPDCWNLTWTSQYDPTRPENDYSTGYRLEQYHAGGTPHHREWPGFLYGNEGAGDYDGTGTDYAFCKLITSKINTLLPIGECRSFISGVNNKTIKAKGVNFYQAFCTSGDKDIPCVGHEIEPTFVAANGQRFYISSVLTANANDNVFGPIYERHAYRFVVVDLNGSAGPNTQFKTSIRYPDIVLFAIDSSGNVIPLGLPEFYQNYIQAVVQYDEYTNKIDPNDPTKYLKNDIIQSQPMSLWDAKKRAWGPQKGHAGNSMYGQGFSKNEPLSTSSIFYFNANRCRETNCVTNTRNSTYADDLYVHLVMQFLYSAEGSSEVPKWLYDSTDLGVDSERGCTTGESTCKIEFVNK